MNLLFKFFLTVAAILFSHPTFSQISSDSLQKRIDVFVDGGATPTGLTRDLLGLEKKYPADSLLMIIKLNLTRYNTYGRPDTALAYGWEALALATKIGSIKGMATCYQRIGEIMRVMGNSPRAVEFTLKALPLAEQQKDTALLLLAYDQLGVAYNGDGDYNNAKKALFKSISLIIHQKPDYNDSAFRSLSYIYLADVYLKMKNNDSALYYGRRANELDSLLKRDWSWTWIQLGKIYMETKNEQQAMFYFKKGLSTYWVKDSIDVNLGMAKLFLSYNSIDSATQYAKRALSEDTAHSYLPEMFESSAILSNAYEKSGNKDSAIKYLKLNISLKDSLFNLDKVREVQNLSLDEKLRQQEITAGQNKAKESHTRNLQLLALGGFIPVFFLLIFLLSAIRVNSRIVAFLAVISLLFSFEFITDLVFPYISNWTNDNPIWETLILVFIAALIELINHRLERWVKTRLTHQARPALITE